MIKNKRIEQLAIMMSSILNEDVEISKRRILGTRIGRRILKNDNKLLYEQQTANLYDLFHELSIPQLKSQINLDEKIRDAVTSLKNGDTQNNNDIRRFAKSESVSKNRIKRIMKKTQLKMNKEKYNNMVNTRRMENAIKNER